MERGLEFNGIEYYDVFEDDVMIFFIDISGLSEEIQSIAQEIDGCNYNPHGFGVCVNYDFLNKEFYLVTDSQNTESPEDEPCNIFYTCQDGNKHWLKADIPQALLDRIFNECGKVVSDREKVQAASGSRLETPPPVQGWQCSFSG